MSHFSIGSFKNFFIRNRSIFLKNVNIIYLIKDCDFFKCDNVRISRKRKTVLHESDEKF